MIRIDAPQEPSSRSLALWLMLALGLALRVWKITDKNLWLDESTSWDLATGSISNLIAWTTSDIHPPLYYLILKGWILIAGDSLAGLRSLSVVSSLVALYLLFRLAAGSLPRGVAYAVVFWFAVSPHAIYYSQEARMYALVTAVVLGACLAYRRWVESGFVSGFALMAYGACAAAALYVHYFTVLVCVAIWLHVIVLTVRRRGQSTVSTAAPPPRWTAWLVVHALIGVLYLPWIGTAIAQITRGQSWRQPVTIGQIPDTALELVRMLTFGVYHVPYFLTVPGAVATSVLAIGLIGLVVVTIKRRNDERDAFFLLLALTPVLLGLAAMPRTGHMDLSRYLPYAMPLAVLAAARGLSRVGARPVVVIAALVAGTAAMMPSLRGYYDTPVKDSDMRPIVSYLRATALHGAGAPQDPILVAPGYMNTEARFISRDALAYEKVDTDAGLWSAVAAHASDARPLWLVVDYRWSGFRDLERDARLQEVDVPGGTPVMNRLFRVVGR